MTQRYLHFCRKPRIQKYGFTLIEALFSVAIVGLSITALMLVMGSGTRVNEFGLQTSTAIFLAEELHGIIDNTPFEDLGSFDNMTFNPTDSQATAIPGLQQYTQTVNITYVNPATLEPVAAGGPQIAARISAAVAYNGVEVTNITWLRMQ